MISYKPLWRTLIDKDMGKMEMIAAAGISRGTLAKMGRGERIALEVIEKICIALECRIEDVIEIKKDPDN